MRAKDVEQIDRVIGRNIRLHRLKKQLSQSELGNSIRLTFQQLQKYESGANRISASRLFRIAQVLRVPVGTFFDGTSEIVESTDAPPSSLSADRAEARIMHAYSKIADTKLQLLILELLEEIASR